MSIGIKIRKTRRALGMNQQEFAEKMQVSQTAVSNWERGADAPSVTALYRLLDLTGDGDFISRELLTAKPQPVPLSKPKSPGPAMGIVDGVLDILSRIEALEQQVELLNKKKAGAR